MDRKRFWIILILFHALFFGKQVFFGNSMLQDSHEYLFAADNMVKNNTLYAWNLNHAYNINWLTKRPFLYPAILVAVKSISFGSKGLFFFLLYLLQNLVSLLCIRMALAIAAKYRPGLNYTHAIIFMLLSFSQVIYANMVMSEIWLQLCLVTMVYILACLPFSTSNILLIALLLIAGVSLKPVMMFAAFCLPLYYLLRARKRLRLLKALITLLPLCYYFSICKWNEQRTGYFHYSSISNINLLHYNTFSMLLNKYGLQKADSIVDDINLEARKQESYAAQQEYIRKSCREQLSDNLPLYGWLHFRGAIYCVLDPGRFDFTQFFNLPHRKNLIYESNKEGSVKRIFRSFLNPLGILLGFLMLFNIFKIYVAIRFAFFRGIQLWLRLLILFFPFYILLFTGPIGTSRFYMPFIPLVFLMFLLLPKYSRSQKEERNSP
jgi:hypothetical protein